MGSWIETLILMAARAAGVIYFCVEIAVPQVEAAVNPVSVQ